MSSLSTAVSVKVVATGERSECTDGTYRSMSPAINLSLQLSYKDSSCDTIPDPFKPKPKISRTPPNQATSTESHETKGNSEYVENSTKDVYLDSNNSYLDTSFVIDNDTYQSSKFNSPSLSIEYPPGSSIPMIKKRKKFQFKKSHYQKFIDTSSAKKTEIIKKSRFTQRSRSNSLISYQSSAAINDEQIEQNNDSNFSHPPSPPSDVDDNIISELNEMMNKTPRNKYKSNHDRVTSNSSNIIVLPRLSDSNQYHNERKTGNDSDITVSSSPSLIEGTSTTTTTKQQHTTVTTTTTTTTKGYSKYTVNTTKYQTKQEWLTLIHQNKIQKQKKDSLNGNMNDRGNDPLNGHPNDFHHYHPHHNQEPKIDPDQIRIALNEYSLQKGQNLEELFRPQKTCCDTCIIL